MRVWDVASRSAKVQGMWVFHSTRMTSVAWSPSGNFVASGSLDERIYIWDVNSPMKKRLFDFSHKGRRHRCEFRVGDRARVGWQRRLYQLLGLSA
ncbi:unnamed protein product [Peronospora destructor]|uniref:Anaphase-promoting complex subunit 4 WD40 domain-containing protein n=1 Tax=Peronospora destructor TaxID=86335 RepID=A0AAV0UWU1_9STRA|nr:unnamed protein product [Peronospora destructor]